MSCNSQVKVALLHRHLFCKVLVGSVLMFCLHICFACNLVYSAKSHLMAALIRMLTYVISHISVFSSTECNPACCLGCFKHGVLEVQANVHMGGGFGGMNVSYNYLTAAEAKAALEQQMSLHAAVRVAVAAPQLLDHVRNLQAGPCHALPFRQSWHGFNWAATLLDLWSCQPRHQYVCSTYSH